jgi:hypothetical protein
MRRRQRTRRALAALSGLLAIRRLSCMKPLSRLTPSEVSSFSRYGSASATRFAPTSSAAVICSACAEFGSMSCQSFAASMAMSARRAWLATSTARRATRGSRVRLARSR